MLNISINSLQYIVLIRLKWMLPILVASTSSYAQHHAMHKEKELGSYQGRRVVEDDNAVKVDVAKSLHDFVYVVVPVVHERFDKVG